MDGTAVIAEIAAKRMAPSPGYWRPEEGDVLRWVGDETDRIAPLLDEVAALTAIGFHEGRLSFEFGDDVANGLYLEALNCEPPPVLFFQFFHAFDAGECNRPGDDPSEDPIQKYTIPQIAAIVAHLRS